MLNPVPKLVVKTSTTGKGVLTMKSSALMRNESSGNNNMRNRIFAVLALAILAGGGLAYGTYNAINAQPTKTVSAPTQPVVVASANLPLGTGA